MRHTRRNENTLVAVGTVRLASEIEPLSRSIGGRIGAKVVENDSGGPVGHVPVIGLMQVIVKPDDGTRLAVTTVALQHLAALGEPFTAVGLNEKSPLVTVNVGIDDVDAADVVGFGDLCHRGAGPSVFAEWSIYASRPPTRF